MASLMTFRKNPRQTQNNRIRNYPTWNEMKYLHEPKKYYADGSKRHTNQIPELGKSLDDLYPEVASEFVKAVDVKEEGFGPWDYKPNQNKRAKFKCKTCGHEWESMIKNRTKLNNGCPKCSAIKNDHVQFGEQYIARVLKVIFPKLETQKMIGNNMSIDIYIPEKRVAIEYGQDRYHEGRQTDSKKLEICQQKNVELLFIFESPKFKNIEIVENGVKIPNKMLTEAVPILDEVLKIICDHLEVIDKLNLINPQMKEKIIGDSLRASVKPPKYEESLEFRYPDIARKWDYQRNWGLNPKDFTPYQHFRAYWKNEKDPKRIANKVVSYDNRAENSTYTLSDGTQLRIKW